MSMTIKRIGCEKYNKWIGKCRNCHSIIECNTSDLKKIEVDNYGDKFSLEDCVYCNKRNMIYFYPYSSGIARRILK